MNAVGPLKQLYGTHEKLRVVSTLDKYSKIVLHTSFWVFGN